MMVDTDNIKEQLKFKNRVLKVSLNKKTITITILGYFINSNNLKLDDAYIYIDQVTKQKYNIKQFQKEISKKDLLKYGLIQTFKFKMEDILKDESEINGIPRVSVKVGDIVVEYRLSMRNRKKNSRLYYVPIKCKYINQYALHFRRTYGGNLVFVKRLKEPIENDKKFKVLESSLISGTIYKVGKVLEKIRRKKINIFYEKFAEKAEEGVFDLCQMCNKSKKTKNYFIIDPNTEDYKKIKQYKNVVKKYSLKYYWLLYNSTSFIASEAPTHVNIIRSNNKYFRRAACEKKFIFLQHGIIYMKNLGVNSAFNKGREAESTYMVVSSEKEKNIVSKMLGYDKEQLLKTGLGIFSKIEYNHITQDSENNITVMLTWKPYEEQLYEFEKSTYYENVIKIYKVLKKYINKENIIIISHPKAKKLLENTDLKESLWDKPVSEALQKTKLLITDYSSVCYNAFYQGAGVIFYQEDLEKYEKENGNLIPQNDEYIGKRVYAIEELDTVLSNIIQNKKILLNNIRTKEFEDNYKKINEFSDGKNIERIYNELAKLKLV